MEYFKLHKETLRGQLYFFRTIFGITDLVTNGFYYILLYKTTDQFSPLFIDLIIYFLAQWSGFIIGNVLIPKFGYVKVFKLSFLWNFIAMILLVLTLQNLAFLYPLFSILRGFPRGLYWSVNSNYLMRELNDKTRNITISDIISISYIIQIVLPVVIGATLLIDNDYSILFIISASISFVSILMPWKYNKKPRTEVTMTEITKILSNNKFNSFSVLLIIHSGLDASVVLSFAIIPFLLLKNEFEVGLFATVINLIAATLTFIQRNKKNDQVKRTSYVGVFINSIFSILFIAIWNIPVLIIRGLFSTVGSSISQPVMEKLDLQIREQILGKDKNKSAAEMGIIIETVYTIGRILALVIFLLMLTVIDNENVFKLIIGIYSIWIVIFLKSLFKEKRLNSTLNSVESETILHDSNVATTA